MFSVSFPSVNGRNQSGGRCIDPDCHACPRYAACRDFRKKVAYRYVTAVTVIRMVLSPIIAAGILYFMPLNDLLKAIIIVQSSMPAASNTTLFALQFGTEPDLVSFTTFVTTLL